MAYEEIKPNFYRSSVGPGGLELGLRYDSSTGDYQLKEKNALGYDAITGNAIFFQNGDWRDDALKDSRLFTDGDKNKPTPFAIQLTKQIKQAAYQAYLNKGGSPKGNSINNTARPIHQNDPLSVNNSFPGTNPGIATATPGLGGLAALPGQGNTLDQIGSIFSTPGLPDIANRKFTSQNEKTIFGNSNFLKYPLDILDLQQDTLQITMYNYQAPLGETFLNPSNISSIFTNGLQRNSALKERIATVILPIPSGIQDSNAVSWGDDQMNNMTAGVTAAALQNLGGVAASQGATALANFATQSLSGANLPTGIINQLSLLNMAGGLTNNPLVKTALTTLLLKNAGFDISPETILARGAGVVPNSNMELLFQGPTLRQFQFSFRMSPRSRDEARNVKRIIRLFKQGSAPRKENSQSGAGARSLFLGTPNVFKLQYKKGTEEISGLNKFKICALVNMQVVYAPDGQWAAYDDSQPVSITMSLNFQELEPVYESDYQEKGPLITSGDNSPVYPEDIGY